MFHKTPIFVLRLERSQYTHTTFLKPHYKPKYMYIEMHSVPLKKKHTIDFVSLQISKISFIPQQFILEFQFYFNAGLKKSKQCNNWESMLVLNSVFVSSLISHNQKYNGNIIPISQKRKQGQRG